MAKKTTVRLTSRDIEMLDNAVPYLFDEAEWVGCPHLEIRVRAYVTSVYRLGSRLKYETAEAKILLAEPYLLEKARLWQQATSVR